MTLAVGSAVAPALAAASATPLITRYVGTGTSGTPVPGPATSSPLGEPEGLAVDAAGNLYIADTTKQVIEKVTPGGTLSIIAGTGTSGAPTAGPATSSRLSYPVGVAVDAAGNVYIADNNNQVIEKVTPGGTLSVFAGTGGSAAVTPGPATSSGLSYPHDVAVDAAGDVYVADSGHNRIEKVTPGGTLSVVAGTSSSGAPTPGLATSSTLYQPDGVAVDAAGDLYIADLNNNRIEKVTPDGTLSVIAGGSGQGTPTAGPAISSDLDLPTGVAVDAAGNVYIADGGRYVEQVTSAGQLSILSGTLTDGLPSYGGPAAGSALDGPQTVAVSPSGAVYVADGFDGSIERIAPAAPVNSAAPVVTGTPAEGQMLTASSGSWTNSPDSLVDQWQDCDASGSNCTSIPNSSSSAYTVASGDVGHTIRVSVTATNAGGQATQVSTASAVVPVPAGPVAPVVEPTTGSAAPLNTVVPSVTGVTGVGDELTCAAGTWSGTPTGYAYQWDRDGAAIDGASAAGYDVQRADQGHTLTCTVTATNAEGTTARVSSGIFVALVGSRSCPGPSGALVGSTLGPVALGETRRHARQRLPRRTTTRNGFDHFCLTGGDIRVGGVTDRLRGSLSPSARTRMRGRIVLVLTANPTYRLDGVRPGTRLTAAAERLQVGRAFHVGLNHWYVITGRHANIVLKVRHGVVQELGIAVKQLTETRVARRRLLSSYRTG